MRQLTIESGEKKPIAYCETCNKPLYKGDRKIKDEVEHYYEYHYCSIDCFLVNNGFIRE